MFSLPRPPGDYPPSGVLTAALFCGVVLGSIGKLGDGRLCMQETVAEKTALKSLLLFTYSCQTLTNGPGVRKRD